MFVCLTRDKLVMNQLIIFSLKVFFTPVSMAARGTLTLPVVGLQYILNLFQLLIAYSEFKRNFLRRSHFPFPLCCSESFIINRGDIANECQRFLCTISQ